jgi:UDP-N-acetyl-D-mannosaminuronate dehydrogenase
MNLDGAKFDLVVGLGETGGPLQQILAKSYPTIGRDIDLVEVPGKVSVLHLCIPFEIKDYIGVAAGYIRQYQPELTIIHSTIVPGTTRAIYDCIGGGEIAYSPIRGKHTRMGEELLKYNKFVAGITPSAMDKAMSHLSGAGMNVRQISSVETLEMAKLLETTYFGLLLAWAQEVERFCQVFGADYDEALALTEEVSYLPRVIFRPGFIGGHCVIPNIHLLEKVRRSDLLDFILDSNEKKKEQWLQEGKDLTARVAPKQFESKP